MRGASALLAAGAVLLLASCGGSNESDPDLVFVSTRDGEYAIYGMRANGSDERRLTDEEIDSSTPQGLLFQTDPAWSPDGSSIAFASKRSGTFDLYAMNANGSGTRRLTTTKDDDGHPSWSADGERIVFVRGSPGRLFVVGADGTGARRLTSGDAEESDPEWSPDGRWVAYARRDPGTSIRELWLVRPDGSQRRRLTKLGGVAQAPSWSPDARQIVFSANVGDNRFDIYTIAVGARNGSRVTSNEDAFEPAWSPDAKTIAFTQGGAVVAIDVATREQRTLTDAENNDSSPAWRPRRRNG